MKNYRLLITYDGTRYKGWEHQPGAETVQGKIEVCLGRMLGLSASPEDYFGANPPIELIGSGRTDAGVHAKGMVASVKLPTEQSPDTIRDYLNHYLPDDIAIREVREASDRFHARYNTTGKTYEYTIFDGPVKPVFNRKYYTALDEPLDADRMAEAAEYFIGEHDFKSFCTNPKMKKSTVRRIDNLAVRRNKGYVTITVSGSGFLQNMVRIIAGTLIEVGYGRIEPSEILSIIDAKDRTAAGPTAPAKGLCLIAVNYD